MRRNLFVLGATSASLLALELVWTRLFSAEFFYTFAFLILSLAIFGLGLGGLAQHSFAFLGRPRGAAAASVATAAAALAGPPLVFALDPDVSRAFADPLAALRCAGAVALLGAPYFFGGIVVSRLLRDSGAALPRYYMVDLLGAALGVLAALPLMNGLGTPAAAFVVSAPLVLAGWAASARTGRVVSVGLALGLAALAPRAAVLLERDREERAPVIHRHWDAMAKVKIFDFGDGYRGLEIDNAANSPLYGFDGNWDRPDSAAFEFGIDVSFLIDRFDSCAFLSLGAGGGGDVLQALQAGCATVHAVEVVPYVNRLMRSGEVADFTGRIYDDPRVTVATEDARAYVRRHPATFDVIYSLSSNTFAALASGAFAMAENYLFTTEAFTDYWRALTDDGFLSMEHQFYMPRIVSEARDALIRLGVPEPENHFAVYALPEMRRELLLLSKRPLTDEIRRHAYGELTPEKDGQIHLLWPPDEEHADNRIARIVRNGWRSEAAAEPIDLSPCTDSRPFTAQLGQWRNLSMERLRDRVSPLAEVHGFPLAKLLVAITVLLGILVVVPLTILPGLRGGAPLRAVPWLYFFTIGAAFLMIEVVLIQKYTFFIGPAPHGLATILVSLLVGSGIGARFADRVADPVPFLGIALWLLLDVALFDRLIHSLPGLAPAGRILVTALLVLPHGFFLGMPFPKGGLRVGDATAWAFAVNGAASVIGSAGVLWIAFARGFPAALLAAGALYVLAWVLLARRAAWEGAGTPPGGPRRRPA